MCSCAQREQIQRFKSLFLLIITLAVDFIRQSHGYKLSLVLLLET